MNDDGGIDPLHVYKSKPDPYFENIFNSEMNHISAIDEEEEYVVTSRRNKRINLGRRSSNMQTVFTNMAVDTKMIKMHAKNCNENDVEVAYMCVAKHEVGGIINLNEFLQPGYEQLILMSHGCKLLKFDRGTFFHYCTKKNLENAKLLAERIKYATNSELLLTYLAGIRWKEYKKETMREILEKKKKVDFLPPIKQVTKSKKNYNKLNNNSSNSNSSKLEHIVSKRNPEMRLNDQKKKRYSWTGELLKKF